MNLFTGIIAFLLIWWTALFAVLPLWVRPSQESGRGHMAGAPENPMLLKKFIVTTILSAVLWLGLFALVEAELFDFRGLAMMMAEEDVRT